MELAIIGAIVLAAVIAFGLRYLRSRPFVPKKGWRHYGSNGKGKTVHYDLPAPNFTFGEPHYMTTDCVGLSGSIYVKYRFTGKVYPVEAQLEQPLISLHFQRKGDNWTAKGKYAGYRWYSRNAYPLTEGEREITIPLEQSHWIPVIGGAGGFTDALWDASRVGLVFGWAGGRGHGVAGEGKFELLEWKIV